MREDKGDPLTTELIAMTSNRIKTAKDVKTGDEFVANVARRRNQWSRPTTVRATGNAVPSSLVEGSVRVEVIIPSTNRKTAVILPASQQI